MARPTHSLAIASAGKLGLKKAAYARVEMGRPSNATSIPEGHTLIGPEMLEQLMTDYGVETEAALLVAMDIVDATGEIGSPPLGRLGA